MSRVGYIIGNIGSPDSTSVVDVRSYLRRFLMDPHVIDLPWLFRFILVHGVILRKRPQRSAKAYEKIWTPMGSPLVVFGERLRETLSRELASEVLSAMRYSQPFIRDVLAGLKGEGIDEIRYAPLFPHYAMSTRKSAIHSLTQAAKVTRYDGRLQVLKPFYDHPSYIAALVESAKPYLDVDHILFSFHGVPERHIRKADPSGQHCLASPDCCKVDSPIHKSCYRAQCLKTMWAFAEAAGLDEERYSHSFQSRLGGGAWLQPYTTEHVVQLAERGVKDLAVICPTFAIDCLETLDEIGSKASDVFRSAGGAQLQLIPCLNDHPIWVKGFAKLLKDDAMWDVL